MTGLALIGVALLLAVAAAAAVLARRPAAPRLVYGACLAFALLFAIAAGRHLLAGADDALVLPFGLPWLGAHFRADPLAAFFLLVINLGAAAASLYGLGQRPGDHHPDQPQRVLPFFPAFLAAMDLVVLAADAFTFLFAWETMSLASWALVMAHHRERENARAGYVYLLMASFGTLSLLLAFGLLAGADGHYAFDAIRAAGPGPALAALVLALAILGAGSKAGLVPLHVWLPLAHPAAPSHVSALMSGVMTKVAVYGFIRIVFDLLGGGHWSFSLPVIVLGAGTAVIGLLYALLETDLKRLLACSTVENVGIIFLGLGLSLAFRASGMEAAAALAMTAALFHVLNHALFKSLLFLGAGAVLSATGHRDLDRLGGLVRAMPVTGFAVLVGAAAISALPPLNGFVSEWLTFQAVLLSPELPQWALKVVVPAAGALLALAAALAAACFVRAYGIAFLGRPRSAEAGAAADPGRPVLLALLALAALCLLAGILPGLVIDAIGPAVRAAVGAAMPPQAGIPWLAIAPVAESRSSYDGLLVFAFIALSAGLAALAIHRFASRRLRRAPAWDCGFPNPSPATQYTASGFAQPIRRVFAAALFGARDSVGMPPPGDLAPARFAAGLRDPAWHYLYDPLAAAVRFLAGRLNRFQFLTIRRYLGLVFLALVGLLLVLAIWS